MAELANGIGGNGHWGSHGKENEEIKRDWLVQVEENKNLVKENVEINRLN
jgi:hypothetical protein